MAIRASAPSTFNVGPSTVIAVVVVALVALNWHLIFQPVDLSPLPSALPNPEATLDEPAPQPSQSITLKTSNYPQTLARPLFFPDRQPPKQKKQTPKNAASKQKTVPERHLPDGIKLVGILRSNHTPGRALIRSKEQPTGNWVEEGQEFDGWRIRRIDRSRVIMETGKKRHELLLFPARAN